MEVVMVVVVVVIEVGKIEKKWEIREMEKKRN